MQGYYQKPTVHQQQLVLVCEDDLWWAPLQGGTAQRLTASPGRCNDPHFAPDGGRIAYTGRDEGPGEVFLLDLEQGEVRRLTFLGADTRCVGFSPDGQWVYFTTNAWQAFARVYVLGRVAVDGGPAEALPWGPANWLSFSGEGRVLGRHTWDSARWKRYRGGTSGQFWIDPQSRNRWKPLKPASAGNLTRPLWLGQRIYYGSDHAGHGNLCSCLPDGTDVRQHTHHDDFYLRHPSSDGQSLVYQCGAEIYHYDLASEQVVKIPLKLRAGGFGRLRRFAAGSQYIESADLHPKGQALAATVRGKAVTFYPYEHPVHQLGVTQGVRYRLASWLPEGEKVLVVSDEGGEEHLEIYPWKGGPGQPLETPPSLGRILQMAVCPKGTRVALSNHQYELWILDWKSGEARRWEQNEFGRIDSMAWSPCGNFLAYSAPTSRLTAQLRLLDLAQEQVHPLTEGCFCDTDPHFDPQGRYLYFLSLRTFNPVWDNLFFEMSFPQGMRPYLLTLREDLPNPFEHDPVPKASEPATKKKRKKEEEGKPTRIDLEGVTQRIVAFPLGEGRYRQIRGTGDSVFLLRFPVEGTLDEESSQPRGTLYQYDFKTLEGKDLYHRISSFTTSWDGKCLFYFSGTKMRLVSTEKKPESNEESPGRKSGWLSPQRIRVSIDPRAEWAQMAREAWRLMREHFWDPEQVGSGWSTIYERYQPLLERVGSRSELSDWIWELQAELGTSHAYESGGDYLPEPHFPMGKLALDWTWDRRQKGYRITRLIAGDCWSPEAHSAGLRLGNPLRTGDVVTHIQGQALRPDQAPEAHLVHTSRQEVQLSLRREGKSLEVVVRTQRFETPARYRAWVEANRSQVHQQSQGRLGYLHIPNMGPQGFSEFHRGYFSEVQRPGLIVDVRYNGGGNVSGLLLEKLSRRILGWDVPRHGQPIPYPMESPRGPLVALTNELAGSDGDIFSHCFKLLQLGPLIGVRTWGGVIGIWPRHKLVDGTRTTQPEFAFWFEDVGWRLENHGTEPDIQVDIRPQDWAAGKDPQLQRAIAEGLKKLEASKLPYPQRSRSGME